MVTIYHQRATKDEHGWTIFHVPRDVQSLGAMAQERIMPGSVVMTDKYRAYTKLGEKRYDHLSVNHSEGEYASGSDKYTLNSLFPKSFVKANLLITTRLISENYPKLRIG